MNIKFKKIILMTMIMAIIVINFVPTFADVGNFNTYDGGFDGGLDSGAGYSDDGDDILALLGWIFWLVKTIGPIPTLVICVVIYLLTNKYWKTPSYDNSKVEYNSPYGHYQTVSKVNCAEEIRKLDPNFSEEKFKSWVGEVFVKLQSAWSQRDWKLARPFETNELFNQHKAQIEEYINNNKINVVERISIQSVRILDYKVENDREILVVELVSKMKDYIVDATSRKVIEGDSNRYWTMSYNLFFERKAGIKTTKTSNISTTNCPNCGAPTEITSSGQCEYCGSIITTGDYDWVLANIKSNK